MAASDDEVQPDLNLGPGPQRVVEQTVESAPLFSGPFWRAIGKRKRQGRDAKILISAEHGQTGVGKTALAVYFAKAIDTSESGFDAETKTTLDIPEFLRMYDELEPGSAAILDEAEQLDSRRFMKNENVDASKRWQMNRVDEIVTILTLPSPDMIDSRMERLADYWINVECRGKARVYEKRITRISRKIYYKTLQTVTWPNMDRDRDYKILSKKKRSLLDDDGTEDNYIRKSKHEKLLEKREKEVRRETRDYYIRRFAQMTDLKQSDIAGPFDLSPGRISQIANEDEEAD